MSKSTKKPKKSGVLSHAAMVAKNTISHKSKVKDPVHFVWDTCDKMKGAKRKDVVDACLKAGVAFYTARTQYQNWRVAGRANQ